MLIKGKYTINDTPTIIDAPIDGNVEFSIDAVINGNNYRITFVKLWFCNFGAGWEYNSGIHTSIKASVPELPEDFEIDDIETLYTIQDGWNTSRYGENVNVWDFGETEQTLNDECARAFLKAISEADAVPLKLRNLIHKANTTTGKSDIDLTSGVNSLIEGYGSGGGGSSEEPILVSRRITENGTYYASYDNADGYHRVEVVVPPKPIEISSETAMNALLTTADMGAVYKYVGETTDTYENGGLYIVEVAQ